MLACSEDITKENSVIANENDVFSVVGTNTVPEVCEYYLKGFNVTQRIEPSNIIGIYSCYDVKTEDNTYIDVILDVKNLNNEAKMADDLISAKIKINSNEYSCFSVAESADGSDLEKYDSIKTLETRVVHYVAEVPIIEANGEIEVILTINGKNFSNRFNLDSIKATSTSVENTVENELENEGVKSNIPQDTQQDITEDEYYTIIKEAWQLQKDYIDSIEDPKVKQSVQTTQSAAILKSNELLSEHPEDSKAINESLSKVLADE